MLNINKFKLNRDKNIVFLKNYLKNYIIKFSNQSNYKDLIRVFSHCYKIPIKYLNNQTKIILFRNFINLEGKFNNKFKFKKIFFDSIKFLLIYMYFRIKSKSCSQNRKRFDLIIDDIDVTTNYNKYKNLSRKFKTAYISNFEAKLKNLYNINNYNKLIISKNEINKLSLKNFFTLFIRTIIVSIKLRCNLFPFTEDFFKNYFKYESIFNQIISKHILQDRHFNTNEIKNFLFKKKGGKFTSVTQRNILQLNGIGMFIFSDIIFSLGKKTVDELENLGGEVRFKKPVGSLAMEYNFYEKKKKLRNNFPAYDVVVFCSDHLSKMHSGYNSYYKDYYLHYEWIAKFALKHQNLNIALKMKRYIQDERVLEYFKKIKNVTFLYTKDIQFSNSYFYAEKSKVLCTWSSTLAFEFFGEKRESFFIDPGFRNVGFIPNKTFLKRYKLSTFEKFEKTILKKINNRRVKKIKNYDYFCLNSKNTSDRISKIFNRL